MSRPDPLPSNAAKHFGWWDKRLYGRDRSYVYVIRAYDGSIKIGIAVNPGARLATLQTAHGRPLELLHIVPGGLEMERGLHYKLRSCRLLGEWFDGPEVPDFLDWMHEFCEQAIQNLWATSELPKPPPYPRAAKPRAKSQGLVSQGGRTARMGHRWRTQPDKDAPVIISQVAPDPKTPLDEAREIRAGRRAA